MNALELADELQVRYKYEECSECMLEAATMLRTLHAENERWKADIVKQQEYVCKLFAENEALKRCYKNALRQIDNRESAK